MAFRVKKSINMSFQNSIKFQSLLEFWEYLPEQERLITDVLRQIILQNLPAGCKEKLAYNVPFYYGKKRICFVWPASIPWGGFKSGVMLGFCYGYKLPDKNKYLSKGSNKQVFYKIFKDLTEIEEQEIVSLLKEALSYDEKLK